MSKYIDADRLRAEIEKLIERYSSIKAKGILQEGYKGGRLIGYEDTLNKLDSLQQEQPDNNEKEKAISLQIQAYLTTASDELYAPGKPLYTEAHHKGIHECMLMWQKLHQYYFSTMQEQPSDEDDGKFVKISVRKELAETFQRLGDEIQSGQSSFVGAVNQQEQPKDKQIVIITESHGDANIEWDCRSLDDVMALLKSAESFVSDKQVEKLRGPGSGPDYATTEGRYSHLFKRQQEQPEVDLKKTVEFECIGKKVKMTVQELINYYIDSECVAVAEECGF